MSGHFESPAGVVHKRKMSRAMRRYVRGQGWNVVPGRVLRRLGRVSDTVLAREVGVHHSTIRYWRWKLGVPSWRTGRVIRERPGKRKA